MQEISLKDNATPYKMLVDDLPIEELIPKELFQVFLNAMADEVYNIIKSKERRRNYYLASKEQSSTKKVPP